jgi:hypothetical protein
MKERNEAVLRILKPIEALQVVSNSVCSAVVANADKIGDRCLTTCTVATHEDIPISFARPPYDCSNSNERRRHGVELI